MAEQPSTYLGAGPGGDHRLSGGWPHWSPTSAFYADLAAPGYSLRDLLQTLFRRRRVIVLFAVGVLAAVAIGVLTHTPVYEASAKILVKKGAAREPLTPRETPVWIFDQLFEEDINTEIGILTSRVLIEQATRTVLDDPSLYADPAPPPAWRQMLKQWLGHLLGAEQDASATGPADDGFAEQVDEMAGALEVEPEPKSNIIALTFVWPDQRVAEAFLTALVDAYQQRRTELYEPSGAKDFFRRQAATAAADLSAAERALQVYLEEAGITMIDMPEEHDILEAEKRSMLDRQKAIAADLGETRARASQLSRLLAKTAEQVQAESVRVRTELRERQRAAVRGQLTEIEQQRGEQAQRLQRLEAEQAEVSAKLAKIRVLEDQLRALLLRDQGGRRGKALKDEVDRLYRELAQLGQVKRYDLNVGQDTNLYEHLKSQIIDAEVTLSGLDRRAEMVQQQLSQLGLDPDASADTESTSSNSTLEPAAHASSSGTEAVWRQIEATRKALARAGDRLDVQDRQSLARGFEARVASMVELEADLEGARARISELEAQYADLEQALTALNFKGTRAKELRRELARAEEAYALYRNKSDTAAISAAMSREELVNTSVAQPPTVATDPVGPGKRTLLMLGLFVAVGGGIGLALLLDALAPGVLNPKQLERRLGLAHLGSIPEGQTEGPLDVGLAALFPTTTDADSSSRSRSGAVPALVYPAPSAP